MGSGRILGVGRLEGVWLRLPPQLSSRLPGPNLHFGVPAVAVEGHLLKEGLPTAVRGVHLGGQDTGHGSGAGCHQLPFVPGSRPGSCLLQDVLYEADQKGAGLGMELVIACREGQRMPGSRLGPAATVHPAGAPRPHSPSTALSKLT